MKSLRVLLLQTGFFSYRKKYSQSKGSHDGKFALTMQIQRLSFQLCPVCESHLITRYDLQHWFHTNTPWTTPMPYKSLMPQGKELNTQHSPIMILRPTDREVLTAPLISAEISTYVNSIIWQELRYDHDEQHLCKTHAVTQKWYKTKETRASHTHENDIFKAILTDILKTSDFKTVCVNNKANNRAQENVLAKDCFLSSHYKHILLSISLQPFPLLLE